jgi:tRNA (guanine-N7-)-methyltransferase
MMSVLSAIPALTNTSGEGKFADEEVVHARRSETKFERRGQRLGHEIFDLLFCFNN